MRYNALYSTSIGYAVLRFLPLLPNVSRGNDPCGGWRKSRLADTHEIVSVKGDDLRIVSLSRQDSIGLIAMATGILWNDALHSHLEEHRDHGCNR
jgi:hypothetical protein